MSNYVTIYIDKLLEKELYKNTNILTLFEENGLDKFKKQIDFTHAFLGLTRKHPNELDKLDEEKRKEKLKNGDWKDFDKRWYESLNTDEFNDGFYGFAPVKSSFNHHEKVFEKNQLRKII